MAAMGGAIFFLYVYIEIFKYLKMKQLSESETKWYRWAI